MLALREARTGVLAALIAALGTAHRLGGAVVVVGTSLGNRDARVGGAHVLERGRGRRARASHTGSSCSASSWSWPRA
jgi:hypothetical protein